VTANPKPSYSLSQIPKGVWVLGFVSMLMDVSSEMIHALLPVYLVTVLGTSMVTVGFIEGIAEATASITKIFSGALSDWLGKAQASRGHRLWARRLHQAGIPAGPHRGLAGGRAPGRSRRQGYSRRAARCADFRYLDGSCAGRELRPAPVTRYSRRLCRAAIGDRLMWWTADNFKTVFWIAVGAGIPVAGADPVRG